MSSPLISTYFSMLFYNMQMNKNVGGNVQLFFNILSFPLHRDFFSYLLLRFPVFLPRTIWTYTTKNYIQFCSKNEWRCVGLRGCKAHGNKWEI